MILDSLSEVYISMSRNKLRIALTGFSIAWGIFMLIVLLGAGNGLLHGMREIFASEAVNVVDLYPGFTSTVSNGLPKYRTIHLDQNDMDMLRREFPATIDALQPSYRLSVRVSYAGDYMSVRLCGVYPSYLSGARYKVCEGRTLNEMDIREQRKVCIMADQDAAKLLGGDPIGKWVELNDIPFRVVGLYHTSSQDSESDFLAPITTMGSIYRPDGHYNELRLVVKDLDTPEANEAFNDSVIAALARRHYFDPSEETAVWIWNTYSHYLTTQSIFSGLRLFIWLIGIATLVAGVMGISNIMLITVRERTHEFGIRKALGARPRQIVSLVLMESVAISVFFGYVGMLCGIGLTQLIDTLLTASAAESGEESIFLHPTVDIASVLAATLVMVVAGMIAGYVPAKRAVSVKPVEALAAL